MDGSLLKLLQTNTTHAGLHELLTNRDPCCLTSRISSPSTGQASAALAGPFCAAPGRRSISCTMALPSCSSSLIDDEPQHLGRRRETHLPAPVEGDEILLDAVGENDDYRRTPVALRTGVGLLAQTGRNDALPIC
ncbi:hypothetical protein [Mesorhizobium captivum]|uniref:hypothetical protein n=1 Tax=Mesorhizobium captivum TaxID=3072319 RepID=UPI002A2493DF|nr:hypothetical protein [Mesorhizobium sp. VK3C]MDX8444774.1 hypothetical protein [Mesorhizobium sp. VK3C]